MLYDIMTVIIITLSIMPPAMLQYYAFEPLLTERKKRLVLGGYAVILLAELFFLLYMIPFGPWSHSYSFYKSSSPSSGFPTSSGPSPSSGPFSSVISTSFPCARR